jgi:hypothetical protein
MQFGPGSLPRGRRERRAKRFIALASEKRPVGAQTLAERSHRQMAAGEAEGLILAAEGALAAAAAEMCEGRER